MGVEGDISGECDMTLVAGTLSDSDFFLYFSNKAKPLIILLWEEKTVDKQVFIKKFTLRVFGANNFKQALRKGQLSPLREQKMLSERTPMIFIPWEEKRPQPFLC